MSWWLWQLSLGDVVSKVRRRVLPNLRYLPRSRLRRCGACRHMTMILALAEDEEFHICVRCRANLRYELLATHIRQFCTNIGSLDVLELDDRSPLRSYLSSARNYTRSYFRQSIEPGTIRSDGAVCEDITHLTFADQSLDVIVSSDVLEHVPDVASALRESARVLRVGGMHVFTVPTRMRTVQRARIEDGKVVHLVTPPEYHDDPLDPAGVLAFWDFGEDLPSTMETKGLEISCVLGPVGVGRRIVWQARRLPDGRDA
jgi:SAM-dependent methyltransferase